MACYLLALKMLLTEIDCDTSHLSIGPKSDNFLKKQPEQKNSRKRKGQRQAQKSVFF